MEVDELGMFTENLSRFLNKGNNEGLLPITENSKIDSWKFVHKFLLYLDKTKFIFSKERPNHDSVIQICMLNIICHLCQIMPIEPSKDIDDKTKKEIGDIKKECHDTIGYFIKNL